MSDKKKQVLDIFEKLLPSLSDMELDRFLVFCEGYALKANQPLAQPTAERATAGLRVERR